MTSTSEKQYILSDNEQEAQRWVDGYQDQDEGETVLTETRLNFQHGLLLKLSDGNLLHPSIDKREIKKVADVGTGTG